MRADTAEDAKIGDVIQIAPEVLDAILLLTAPLQEAAIFCVGQICDMMLSVMVAPVGASAKFSETTQGFENFSEFIEGEHLILHVVAAKFVFIVGRDSEGRVEIRRFHLKQ